MTVAIPKRGRGRPRADRTANPSLIRQRMAERGIRTIPELGDRVGELIGRPIQDSTLSRIVSGKWRTISLQRAIARVLGLKLDEAFPKAAPSDISNCKMQSAKPKKREKEK